LWHEYREDTNAKLRRQSREQKGGRGEKNGVPASEKKMGGEVG